MIQIIDICKLLIETRGYDFTGYREPMLNRRLEKRLFATKQNNLTDYYNYILQNDDEIDNIIDVLTINVSHFFRNPLAFEVVKNEIFPKIILKKKETSNNIIRIWSAGCSEGQEAYSLSIALDEYLKEEKQNFEQFIFATDIDKKALKKASDGIYKTQSLYNVKLGTLKNYFIEEDNCYKVSNEIKSQVKFSIFDLTDKNRNYPVESIYGGFDLVSCRNVLIYFNINAQEVIMNKLYNSLNIDGYLFLGESEVPSSKYNLKFVKETSSCKVYKKIR
ncbi:MAG: chemotaxis protein CheR [Marinilabiliales bacterium]|nr:MAG: chemotaxis protein CheR [Marinilabiliales bacterium]